MSNITEIDSELKTNSEMMAECANKCDKLEFKKQIIKKIEEDPEFKTWLTDHLESLK